MARFATTAERNDFFRTVLAPCDRRPADPGDIRFEIVDVAAEAWEQDGISVLEDCPSVRVEMIDDTGTVVRTDWVNSTWEATSIVQAVREVQCFSLEERLGPYGIEWEREMEERGAGW